MKVFISSVITGLEPYREAAVHAARTLRHEVKRAEDFTASPATPQQACLAGVRWADVVILLLGARYGAQQASGLSATHEEYREARERCPVLLFVERGVETEPAQRELLHEARAWTTGHYSAPFSDAEELRDAVTVALRDLEIARAVGPLDEGEMVARARALLPDDRYHQTARLTLVVVGGPQQQVLRPRELEAPALDEALTQQALFSPLNILDRTAGTRPVIRGNALEIVQDNASVLLDQLGTVRIVAPAERPRARGDLGLPGVAIREDIEELLHRMLRFVASTLDRIDPLRRLSDVVPVVTLQGAMTWRTRAEHERNPNTYSMRSSNGPVIAWLTPARRHRASLTQDAAAIAEDLVVLLGRAMRS